VAFKTVSDPQKELLREKLLVGRREVLDSRREIQGAWETLREPVVELGETAQKENLSQALGQLDTAERDKIEAIDRALRKMEMGQYGLCESCRRPIDPKRLEALPATALCRPCAQKREGIGSGDLTEEPEDQAELPPEFQGFSDEELEKAVWDELENDGRIDLEELRIECEDGVVFLEGALPSEEQHSVVLQLIGDTMDLPNVEDHVIIDRTLRQREDDEEAPAPGKTEKEVLFEGEDVNDDVFESGKKGIPLAPGDVLLSDD